MGKTLVYVVLLGILGFGVYYFLLRKNDGGLYSEREANFTIRDTGAIGKIFLVRNDGQSILLERKENNEWLLNKKYPVMAIQLRNFLNCLSNQTAHSPVSDDEHDRVVKLLAGLSTKAEIYDRKGNKIRTFFVAGQGSNYHGSYMILENAQTPYLVELPGFEGYISPLYSTEFYEWRSREIADLSAEKIKSVRIDYPNDSMQSFVLDNSGKQPVVLLNGQKLSAQQLNMNRVNSYLGFFSKLNAENYMNGSIDLDSVIGSSVMRCKMQLTDKAENTVSLSVFWKDDVNINLKDQTSTDPKNRPIDVERMYAVNDKTHDTLLIQARTFEKIFRKGIEFYEGNSKNYFENKPNE